MSYFHHLLNVLAMSFLPYLNCTLNYAPDLMRRGWDRSIEYIHEEKIKLVSSKMDDLISRTFATYIVYFTTGQFSDAII